ncbi:MAG: hypothetical protein J6A98_03885 [Clostridia bacterium]|nr:hypothetical protein [Clostridia bacterium]
MTVKEILKSAILFTNNAPLLGLSTFCETSQIAPTPAQQADIDLYLKCFNFVYKEIASAYFPLLEKEEIKFEDNKFYIEELNKKLLNIKKIFVGRKKLKFFMFPDHIFCEADAASIVYSYLPNDFALDDEVNLFGGRVLAQVMAYGVAREYSFIVGNFADADVWECRFKQALEVSFSAKPICLLPKRRFF